MVRGTANRKGEVPPNWRRLPAGEKPQPGDVAALGHSPPHVGDTGHSGIITNGDEPGEISNVSAHEKEIGPSEDEFHENSTYGDDTTVYLRYKGD